MKRDMIQVDQVQENKVPKELNFLSCDMDSHDFWVFRAILQAGYRPRVITTEYNSNYYLNDTITLLDPNIWLWNDLLAMYPSSILPFEWFFERAPIDPLHHRTQSSPEYLSLMIDYKTHVITAGNLTTSNEVARNILKESQLPCYKDIYQYV